MLLQIMIVDPSASELACHDPVKLHDAQDGREYELGDARFEAVLPQKQVLHLWIQSAPQNVRGLSQAHVKPFASQIVEFSGSCHFGEDLRGFMKLSTSLPHRREEN